MLDLGPERPGQASETRQMTEADRAMHPTGVSGRAFWVFLVAIVAAIVMFFVLR